MVHICHSYLGGSYGEYPNWIRLFKMVRLLTNTVDFMIALYGMGGSRSYIHCMDQLAADYYQPPGLSTCNFSLVY